MTNYKSFRMRQHLNSAALMSELMNSLDYISVFEKIQEVLDSQRVWILWVHSNGDQIFSVVDHNGNIGYYDLKENCPLENLHIEREKLTSIH